MLAAVLLTTLAAPTQDDFSLRPSASDSRIVLIDREGLVVVDGDERRVVPRTKDVGTVAWDVDAEHLLVTRGAELQRITVGDEPESEVLLGSDRWLALRMPDASRDGRHVVLAAQRQVEEHRRWFVLLLDRASGETRELSDGYDPCFDASGEAVFFERYPGRDVWRVALDGGEPERLLDTEADRYTVSADPHSDRIAFSSEGALVVRDLESGEERRTGLPQGVYERFASFAPNGRHVLFFRQWPQGHACPHDTSLVEWDLETGAERIVAGPGAQLGAYAPRPPEPSPSAEVDGVERGAGGDEERGGGLAAEAHVRRPLGDRDVEQVLAVR